MERKIHLILAYYTGLNGCFSYLGTKQFIKKVDKIRPDIIHLHNLHNCYINLGILFDYIKNNNIPVVWTLHDCWSFTGQCPHFTVVQCNKWKTGCYDCPQYKEYPKSMVDKTKRMYNLKKSCFTGINDLTIVTPSKWLSSMVKKSFLKSYAIKVINNGIDLNIFKPTPSEFRKKYGLDNKIVLLGVANPWTRKKGLDIFVDMSKRLNKNYKIVLVGLSSNQIQDLPSSILGLPKTDSAKELAEIYTAADYFINPSMEETMGLVTVEALACGTPVIVSNSTAVPEVINKKCGKIVSDYSAEGFCEAVKYIENEFLTEDCIRQAHNYDMNEKYQEYINLYRDILYRN